MSTDVDVLVIGGGLSGLAAAFGVRQQGATVEVLEALPRTGGVIGTLHRDGALVETGPNSALDNAREVNELLDALGIRAQRVEASSSSATRFIVRDGRLVALPLSPGAFLLSPAFSLGAKLRLLREPFIARAPADREESIAAFVRRRLGREFADYAVDPFVSGVYAGDPERISAAAAFPRIHALEQQRGSVIVGSLRGASAATEETTPRRAGAFAFRDGMQTLTDALNVAVGRVSLGVRAQSLRRDIDGAWVVGATQGSQSVSRCAKSVILSVPAYDAAALMRPLTPAAAQDLDAIDYAPIAGVATAYRRDDVTHSLKGFGFLVPAKERRRILGSLFSSSMFDGRAPAGQVLLTTFVGGVRQPELVSLNDEELSTLVGAELKTLVGIRAAPLWSTVTRWTRAIPQYNLGHRERLRSLDAAERALAGLFFCANYRGGVAVGDCIRSAHATAGDVARFLRAPTATA